MIRNPAIEASVEQVIRFVESQPQSDDQSYEDRKATLASLAYQPDNYIVEGYYDQAREKHDSEFEGDDQYELSTALGYLSDRLPGRIFQDDISRAVNHHFQHAVAMRHLGIRTVKYGFRLHENDPDFGWEAYGWGYQPGLQVSKLAIASVIAYPTELSGSDIESLDLMGYKGVADVGERIDNSNHAASRTVLPVPTSYFYGYSLRPTS